MDITNNHKILFSKEVNLSKLSIFGIKLGDEVDTIPVDKIKDKSYDGNTIMIHGGVWLQSNKNKVVGYWIYSELLSSLNIDSEAVIVVKFGKTKEINKESGMKYYYYPDRQLIIIWDMKMNELSRICIGEVEYKYPVFTSKELLYKILEFQGMTSDNGRWNEKSLRKDSYRFYMFKEIASLMKAFKIGDDINDFFSFDFIRRRDSVDYKPIIEQIKSFEEYEKKEFGQSILKNQALHEYSVFEFEFAFSILLDFRIFLEKVLNYRIMEAGSNTVFYSAHIMGNLIKSINKEAVNEIDRMLVLIIDPKMNKFKKHELIERFDFPDVDLKELEWKNP